MPTGLPTRRSPHTRARARSRACTNQVVTPPCAPRLVGCFRPSRLMSWRHTCVATCPAYNSPRPSHRRKDWLWQSERCRSPRSPSPFPACARPASPTSHSPPRTSDCRRRRPCHPTSDTHATMLAGPRWSRLALDTTRPQVRHTKSSHGPWGRGAQQAPAAKGCNC